MQAEIVLKVRSWAALALACLLCTPAWVLPIGVADRTIPSMPVEIFDPELTSVSTLKAAREEVGKMAPVGGFHSQREIAIAIESVLRRRFYHGYSEYVFLENPFLSAISLLKPDVRAIIDPNDIIKFPYAGCSQQAIVFQALLSSYGIQYATLGTAIPKHFTSLAKLDGTWSYVDSWDRLERSRLGPVPLSDLRSGRAANLFRGEYAPDFLKAIREGRYQVRAINSFPGARGLALQSFSRALYVWLPLVVAFWIILTHLGLPRSIRTAFRSRTRPPALHDEAGRVL
jgi:hypothetical protein